MTTIIVVIVVTMTVTTNIALTVKIVKLIMTGEIVIVIANGLFVIKTNAEVP